MVSNFSRTNPNFIDLFQVFKFKKIIYLIFLTCHCDVAMHTRGMIRSATWHALSAFVAQLRGVLVSKNIINWYEPLLGLFYL